MYAKKLKENEVPFVEDRFTPKYPRVISPKPRA